MEQPPDNEHTDPDRPTEPPEDRATDPPSQDRPTEPSADPPTEPLADTSAPRRLTRSSEDRMISGVCGGIARYFGVDSTVVRIATVVLALFGGAGALLYLAALLLMPNDSATAEPDRRNRTLTIIGVTVLLLIGWPLILGGGILAAGTAVPVAMLALAGLLVWWLVSGEGPDGSGRDIARRAALGVGVLLICGAIALAGGLAAGLGGGTAVAALVIASGVMLIAGAFFGGVRWLIPPALSLALAVGFVSAAGIDLHGGVGERDYRPTSTTQLRDSYRVGAGQLVVDLRGVDLPEGDIPLKLDVGMGEARLIVPEDVCVASKATIGAGAVDLFGGENGGIDLDWDDRPSSRAGNARVIVDADIGVGALTVRHDRSEEIDRGPLGSFRGVDDKVGNVGCRETRAAR